MADHARRDDGDAEAASGALARLLEAAHLERVVPRLAPEVLHQLIRRLGLEACTDVVAAATPAQITAILDLDLWHHATPGQTEHFDADRFADWIESLVDADVAIAARIVASLDVHLVVTGLARYIRVYDAGVFAPAVASDDEAWEADESGPEGPGSPDGPEGRDGLVSNVGGYVVQARRSDAWDAIVMLLSTLAADHGTQFHIVMRECRALSDGARELDGLDDLLGVSEQVQHDTASARLDRRSAQGYSTAADARAFLALARQRECDVGDTSPEPNPIAVAHRREARDAALTATAPAAEAAGDAGDAGNAHGFDDSDEVFAAVVRDLAEAGLLPSPRMLLHAPDASPTLTPLRARMQYVHDHDATAYLMRGEELAFLANTLVAGCGVQGRAFSAAEASDAVVAVCNLALDWSTHPLPDAYLVDHDLTGVFEAGWATLHRHVSLRAARHVAATLTGLGERDATTRSELNALRRTLVTLCEQGTPWRARDLLDPIASLDTIAWMALLGLFSECPVIPAALSAIVERRTGAVSPTAYEFIATRAQVEVVHAFLTRLPDLLRS